MATFRMMANEESQGPAVDRRQTRASRRHASGRVPVSRGKETEGGLFRADAVNEEERAREARIRWVQMSCG